MGRFCNCIECVGDQPEPDIYELPVFEALSRWLDGVHVQFKLNVNESWTEITPLIKCETVPVEFTIKDNQFRVLYF